MRTKRSEPDAPPSAAPPGPPPAPMSRRSNTSSSSSSPPAPPRPSSVPPPRYSAPLPPPDDCPWLPCDPAAMTGVLYVTRAESRADGRAVGRMSSAVGAGMREAALGAPVSTPDPMLPLPARLSLLPGRPPSSLPADTTLSLRLRARISADAASPLTRRPGKLPPPPPPRRSRLACCFSASAAFSCCCLCRPAAKATRFVVGTYVGCVGKLSADPTAQL